MADPVVQIEGVGNVQFPASMSEDEIGEAAHRLYTGAAAKQISDNPPAVQSPAPSPEFQNPLPTEKIPIAGAMAQPFGELAANLAYDPAFRKETAQYGAGSAAVAGGAALSPAI